MNIIDREALKHEFISRVFANISYKTQEIPADASFRKYSRITFENLTNVINFNNDNTIFHNINSLILMDSPLEYYDIMDFIKVDKFLINNKAKAPCIYHQDLDNGFLLIEDFGSISIKDYILKNINNVDLIQKVYQVIIKLLIKIQSINDLSSLNLKSYSKDLLINELGLYVDWYLPYILKRELTIDEKKQFFSLWNIVLDKYSDILLQDNLCLLLRDYHVENLMYINLSDSSNDINELNIGLLDFQDALIGSPIYDLVSLLQDARIQVDKNFANDCFNYYYDNKTNNKLTKDESWIVYNILGAQRNSRILGVFVRKAIHDGQDNYLNYIPRVLSYLNDNLANEYLYDIKQWIESIQ